MINLPHLFLITCIICVKSTHAASIIPDYPMHEGLIDIHPYVTADTVYDSNIFRLQNGAQAKSLFGSSSLSDRLFELEFGLATKMRLSNQLILLDLNVNQTKYNRFSNLDYVGNNKRVQWDWQLGNNLNGIISYNSSKQDSGFADVVSSAQVVRENNLRTTNTTHADINWQLQSEWSLFSSFENADSVNSSTAFRFNDRQETTIESGVLYQSHLLTNIGLSVKRKDYDYANRSAASLALFGNSTVRKELIGRFGSQLNARTNLNVQIAAVNIDYPQVKTRKSDNLSQNWTLVYAVSPDTQISLNAFKDFNQVDDILYNTAEVKGFAITPSWNVTSKITVGGLASIKKQDYLGSSGAVLTSNPRSDKLESYGVNAKYLFSRRALLALSYLDTQRSSNMAGISFKDKLVRLTAGFEY